MSRDSDNTSAIVSAQYPVLDIQHVQGMQISVAQPMRSRHQFPSAVGRRALRLSPMLQAVWGMDGMDLTSGCPALTGLKLFTVPGMVNLLPESCGRLTQGTWLGKARQGCRGKGSNIPSQIKTGVPQTSLDGTHIGLAPFRHLPLNLLGFHFLHESNSAATSQPVDGMSKVLPLEVQCKAKPRINLSCLCSYQKASLC